MARPAPPLRSILQGATGDSLLYGLPYLLFLQGATGDSLLYGLPYLLFLQGATGDSESRCGSIQGKVAAIALR